MSEGLFHKGRNKPLCLFDHSRFEGKQQCLRLSRAEAESVIKTMGAERRIQSVEAWGREEALNEEVLR